MNAFSALIKSTCNGKQTPYYFHEGDSKIKIITKLMARSKRVSDVANAALPMESYAGKPNPLSKFS